MGTVHTVKNVDLPMVSNKSYLNQPKHYFGKRNAMDFGKMDFAPME